MIIDCVLTACNSNNIYSSLIPMFIQAWNILFPEMDVKIIYIDDNIPDNLKNYEKSLILYKPHDNISTAFISQYIRLLYPALLNYKNGVLITDVDIIPLCRSFYLKYSKDYDNNTFVHFSPSIIQNQIIMCYNLASPIVWSKVCNISCIEDINKRLNNVYYSIKYTDGHGKDGWTKDQEDLYHYLNNYCGKKVLLNNLKVKRLPFNRKYKKKKINIDDNLIINGNFDDVHVGRPYEDFKEVNDHLINLIKQIKK